VLERGLRLAGHEPTIASDLAGGRAAWAAGVFDVVLLDVMLPGMSGYRVLERMREQDVTTPVLLISAKSGEVDQADGLDLGADGYLVKPFSFLVLVAQVRALLRRRDNASQQACLRVGALEIDRSNREVHWDGQPVTLSPREFGLLVALASHPESVVPKDDLLRMVWGEEQFVTRNVVEVYVGYLRRKLTAVGAGELVQTVRGQGYRVCAEA